MVSFDAYRIVQEALTNRSKHAHGTHAQVRAPAEGQVLRSTYAVRQLAPGRISTAWFSRKAFVQPLCGDGDDYSEGLTL